MEQEGTWEEYGTPGTTTLSHDDIERAIARLARLWDEAEARTQPYKDFDGCGAIAS
jgi:hypothetical protein